MNATELFLSSGKTAGIWFCGKCRIVQKTQEDAERHCSCFTCGKHQDWSAGRIRTECDECSGKRRAKLRQERIENAVEVPSYDGPLYLDRGGYEDDYFQDMDDLLERLYCEGEDDETRELPEWAFCCTTKPVSLDASRVIEWATDDHFDDAADHLCGVEELEKAIDAFNEANKEVVSWNVDYKRKVRIPREESEVQP